MCSSKGPKPEVVDYVKAQAAEAGLGLSSGELDELITRADAVAACALGGRMDRDDRKQVRRIVEEYRRERSDDRPPS
jgi:hypothetical protein